MTPAGELLAAGVRFELGACRRCHADQVLVIEDQLCAGCHYYALEAAEARAFLRWLHRSSPAA
jgi:hypothetical protein